jgi:hypothetical protein
MVSRMIAVAVALVMTGAPVVTAACEAVCATRANDGGTMGEHHSCHHQASPANETEITSAPHVCGHSDDGPSAVAQSLSLLAAPAVIVVAFTLASPSTEVAHGAVASGHDPPLVAPRSAQLRI